MSLYQDIKTKATQQLPESGSVGTLRANRPGLYYLVIITTLTAYIGIILFTLLALTTLMIAAVRTLIAGAGASNWLATVQWYILALAAMATGGVPVYVAARWAGQYTATDN